MIKLALYRNILENSRVAKLSDTLWRVLIELIIISSEHKQLPALEEIAFILRTDDTQMLAYLEALESDGFVIYVGEEEGYKLDSAMDEIVSDLRYYKDDLNSQLLG